MSRKTAPQERRGVARNIPRLLWLLESRANLQERRGLAQSMLHLLWSLEIQVKQVKLPKKRVGHRHPALKLLKKLSRRLRAIEDAHQKDLLLPQGYQENLRMLKPPNLNRNLPFKWLRNRCRIRLVLRVVPPRCPLASHQILREKLINRHPSFK